MKDSQGILTSAVLVTPPPSQETLQWAHLEGLKDKIPDSPVAAASPEESESGVELSPRTRKCWCQKVEA